MQIICAAAVPIPLWILLFSSLLGESVTLVNLNCVSSSPLIYYNSVDHRGTTFMLIISLKHDNKRQSDSLMPSGG